MVRLRQQNGETTSVDRLEAVEILDMEKHLAAVIIQDRKGLIHVAYPSDPLFVGYCRAHGLKPARVLKHNFESTDTV